nr:SAM-dependent methyltransferase [Sphingomonas formosensis]
MGFANAHYYASRDPLGVAGDFITAPEISQMFGELIGLWLADLWMRAGRPAASYAELGPGRGTLAADAARAMRAAKLVPPIHLVETSPVLRTAQRERLPAATWHDDAGSLPEDGPLLIVANEFFDALPVRQLVRTAGGWREHLVGWQDGRFVPVAGEVPMDALVPEVLRDADAGSVFESSPASAAIIAQLARRLATQGGVMLLIDYGYAGPAIGDTLQAVRRHAYADPFVDPGSCDLTAHVDFASLAATAQAEGVQAFGPVGQGEWLERVGIGVRAEALARSSPTRAGDIAAARVRLTAPGAMGQLFRVLALVAPGWPVPEGFA